MPKSQEKSNFKSTIDSQDKIKEHEHTQRQYAYDERDRMIHTLDYNINVYFTYGEDGNRTNKYDDNRNKETLYFNQYWVEHVNGTNRAYSGDSIKHIFLNNERLVSKVCTNNLHGSTQTYLDYEQMHTYYWHSDHLGSAMLITDYQGKEYERIEYTPYGELWIDQNQAYVDGYLPYRFTGKELDEETGLYYYGQRYLDPQYNIWMTSDPAIYDYMSQSKNGEGGIYNITNLNLYHYAGNNPIKYTDPNGRTLTVEGDEDYMRQVEADLKKLSPAAVLDYETGLVSLDPNVDTSDCSYGTELLQRIINDKNNVTIGLKGSEDGNREDVTGEDRSLEKYFHYFLSYVGIGTDSIVSYNPNGQTDIYTLFDVVITPMGREPFIGLSHELIHALHDINGTNTQWIPIDSYSNLLGQPVLGGPNHEELRTVGIPGYCFPWDITENKIRAEHGFNLRGQY